MARRKRKPTVWQALNEPVIHVTEEQAKNIFLAAVIIMFAAWVAPYWTGSVSTVYASETVFEQMATVGMKTGTVAGATFVIESEPQTPDWYYVAQEVPEAVAESFALGAAEVLDISGPVTDLVEFYEPGVDAVWNAWLDLMMDPVVN